MTGKKGNPRAGGKSGAGRRGGRRDQGSQRGRGTSRRRSPASSGPNRRRKPRGLGGDQVEGRQAVRELLLAGKRPVREVLMIDDLARADILDDIDRLAQEVGVPCRKVSRRHLTSEAMTESHQGVVARAAPLAEAGIDDLMADPKAFLLVLDGVTDPGNLGAILRAAECAGVSGVILGRHRAVHVTPTVTKVAAGAVEHVPLALVAGIPTAISQLAQAGILTVGLDESGKRSLFELPTGAGERIALVLGDEGQGLSQLVRKRVDILASIPLAGYLNSLNVATASAVACFEVVRLRQDPRQPAQFPDTEVGRSSD